MSHSACRSGLGRGFLVACFFRCLDFGVMSRARVLSGEVENVEGKQCETRPWVLPCVHGSDEYAFGDAEVLCQCAVKSCFFIHPMKVHR